MLLGSEFNLVGPKWVVAIMFHNTDSDIIGGDEISSQGI